MELDTCQCHLTSEQEFKTSDEKLTNRLFTVDKCLIAVLMDKVIKNYHFNQEKWINI